MSLAEDFECLEPAAEVQKAFDGSATINFSKENMHPWTMTRHSVAMSMGCSVMSGIGPSTMGLLAKGNYPNILKDVIIVLWLCSLPPEEVSKLNFAHGEADLARAFEWGEKVGLVYGSKLFLEGVQVLSAIVNQIHASFFKMKDAQVPDTEQDFIGPRGKSPLPTRQRKPRAKQPVTSET